MFRFLAPFVATLVFAPHVCAATPDEVQELVESIGLADMVDVMQAEGLEYGDEMGEDLFAGRNAGDWHAVVGSIYDTDWMKTTVTKSMQDTLRDTDITPLATYFASDNGQQVIGLEISARKALMDESIEDASIQNVEQMIEDDDPRMALLDRFVNSNDLLENNVVSALNSNFAFFAGMADGGAFDGVYTEEQMLRDVWEQEPTIRDDSREWLYSFLALAYQPLDDETLIEYIELGETPEGQDFNRALFIAFDDLFEQMSGSLGRSAALFMAGEDL